MSEISVSQINSFQSLWPASPTFTEHFKLPHFFITFIFLRNRLYIFQDSARCRWSRFLSVLLFKRPLLVRIQVWLKNKKSWNLSYVLICDTDLLDDVFNSKGVPWQHKQKQAGYFRCYFPPSEYKDVYALVSRFQLTSWPTQLHKVTHIKIWWFKPCK